MKVLVRDVAINILSLLVTRGADGATRTVLPRIRLPAEEMRPLRSV